MKIVIDSNRVIASLIKEGTTREILFDKKFEFFAPEFIKSEIDKYKEDILNKSGLINEEFEVLLSLIFEYIKIIPELEYKYLLDDINLDIEDINDILYLAVCLFIYANGLWTHDSHFKEQNKCKVFTNIDMLNFSI